MDSCPPPPISHRYSVPLAVLLTANHLHFFTLTQSALPLLLSNSNTPLPLVGVVFGEFRAEEEAASRFAFDFDATELSVRMCPPPFYFSSP
ncbi:hypothetical protein SKAU_G00370620 [Synaphobranchus kaupii]|uniref:Uncharacterized protein n=1 Tax=Synaphobranchus kaupii TaxID=118154 RepID=A0A9Q1EFZ5_SYNKA|nr:hypothetical protein SKAU_G00370620 [Synaphobranchus kaupii]